MAFLFFTHTCFSLKRGHHPTLDALCSTAGSFSIECLDFSLFGVCFFAFQLLRLARHIAIDWFVLHITWFRILFIMLSTITGLGHGKFNRLRNRHTKRNRILLLLYQDCCYIHSSPKIRAEYAWQASHVGCLCNFDVACLQHTVAETWITRCFHPPHERDRILRSLWDTTFIPMFSNYVSPMAA